MPTLAEIDSVVSDRPVFIYQGGGGPARTNTLGKQFFESATGPLAGPVTVADDGSIAGGNPSMANRALYHLRIRQTFEDKKRSALDAMAYSASVGVTTNLDQTLVAVATGTLDPASLDPQPTHALFNLNHYRMYDAWLALHAEDKAFIRLQMNFLHNQGFIADLGTDIAKQLPELRERLKNQFQFFGDDMLRTGAIGEWAAPFALPANANGYAVWLEAQRLCAQAGWRNENAQAGSPTSTVNIEQVVATYEQMDRDFGIKALRWGLQHADFATADQLARLKALNCGVSMSGFRWLNGVPRADGLPVGPLFPQIIASGIPAGLHEDGVHIAPHNPWFALHYATTGLNVLGEQINPGQQISRQDALRAYTRGNAWYLNREDDLGSIESGKLADLVVLDKDYFTVSDDQMRRIRPILTVVDGEGRPRHRRARSRARAPARRLGREDGQAMDRPRRGAAARPAGHGSAGGRQAADGVLGRARPGHRRHGQGPLRPAIPEGDRRPRQAGSAARGLHDAAWHGGAAEALPADVGGADLRVLHAERRRADRRDPGADPGEVRPRSRRAVRPVRARARRRRGTPLSAYRRDRGREEVTPAAIGSIHSKGGRLK